MLGLGNLGIRMGRQGAPQTGGGNGGGFSTLLVLDWSGNVYSYQIADLIVATSEALASGTKVISAFEGFSSSSDRMFVDASGTLHVRTVATIHRFDSEYNADGSISLPRTPDDFNLCMRKSDGQFFYETGGTVYTADVNGENEASLATSWDHMRAMDFDNENDRILAMKWDDGKLYAIDPSTGDSELVVNDGPGSGQGAGRGFYHPSGLFVGSPSGSATTGVRVWDVNAGTFTAWNQSSPGFTKAAVNSDIIITQHSDRNLHRYNIDGTGHEQVTNDREGSLVNRIAYAMF